MGDPFVPIPVAAYDMDAATYGGRESVKLWILAGFFGLARPSSLTCHLPRFIGVADLASVRFSLPSQLLEPTPNLEYWNYLDSPNAFVAIGTADEPVDRMLEVLRFWFTKDLKYAKGKPCKPYNSCLGEFFRVGRCQHRGRRPRAPTGNRTIY